MATHTETKKMTDEAQAALDGAAHSDSAQKQNHATSVAPNFPSQEITPDSRRFLDGGY